MTIDEIARIIDPGAFAREPSPVHQAEATRINRRRGDAREKAAQIKAGFDRPTQAAA